MSKLWKAIWPFTANSERRELSAITGEQRMLDLANTDPQTPIVLMFDNSSSTGWNGVNAQLVAAVHEFATSIREDPIAARRVRVAGYTFGGGLRPFTNGFVQASDFYPPKLGSGGMTPMGKSLLTICDHVQAFRELCIEMAVECNTVQVLVLTDGEPTDGSRILEAAHDAMVIQEEMGLAQYHAFVVDGCKTSRLDAIFPRPAQVLSVSEIVPLFRSVSQSMRRVSRRSVQTSYDLNAEVLRDLERGRHGN